MLKRTILITLVIALVLIVGCGSPTMVDFLEREKEVLDTMAPTAVEVESAYKDYAEGTISYGQFRGQMVEVYKPMAELLDEYFKDRKAVKVTDAEREDDKLIETYRYSANARSGLFGFVKWIVDNPNEVRKDVDYIFSEEVQKKYHQNKEKFYESYSNKK
ncbi:MAG: hypothetical protein ACOX4Q_06490 [Syntrophomonadales bacterium]|jgi:hypothetical protein